MAVVNKVHKQDWQDSIKAPYIITQIHPYISSYKPDLAKYQLQLLMRVTLYM